MRQISVLIILIILSFNFVKAQRTAISNNEKYIAVCFYTIRDSSVMIHKEGRTFKEKLYFYKYKVNIYNKSNNKIIQSYTSSENFTLSKKLHFKVFFSGNDNNVFVASGQRFIDVINVKYGFTRQFEAADVSLNSSKTKVILNEKFKIRILNSSTLDEIQTLRYTSRNWYKVSFTKDDRYVIISKPRNNEKSYAVIDTEIKNNSKNVRADDMSYKPSKKEFMVLNRGGLSLYKAKKKISRKTYDVKKNLSIKDYRLFYRYAAIQPEHKYVSFLSKNKITILKNRGKIVHEFPLPQKLISAKWSDNKTLRIETIDRILYYDIEDRKYTKKLNLKISLPGNKKIADSVFFYDREISSNDKFLSFPYKNGLYVKNIEDDKQVFIKNVNFINIDTKNEYIFVQESKYNVAYYKLNSLFGNRKKRNLKSKPLNNLSPLSASYYKKAKLLSFISPNTNIVTNPIFNVDVTNLRYSVSKTKNKKNEDVIDSSIVAECECYNSIYAFDTKSGQSSNIIPNKVYFNYSQTKGRFDFIENSLINKKIKEKISNLWYDIKNKNNKIKNIKVTNEGKMIITDKTGEENKLQIIDIETLESIKELDYKFLAFSPDNKLMAVGTESHGFSLYNTNTGKLLFISDLNVSELYVTNNPNFVIAKSYRDYFYVTPKSREILHAGYIKISDDGKKLFTLSKNRKKITIYNLEDFKNREVKELTKETQKVFRKHLPKLSTDFKHFFVFENKDKLKIYETGTNKYIEIANVLKHNKALWLDNERLIISHPTGPEVYNIKSKHYEFDRNFKFYFPDKERYYLSPNQYKGKISKSENFAVINFKRSGNNFMYFKNTKQQYHHYFIPNATFLAFSKDEKRIYFKKGESKIGYVKTDGIKKNVSADKLSIILFKIPLRTNRILPPTPAYISRDAKPPKDYHYERIKKFKHISKANGDSLIGIYLHNVVSKGNNVTINVHLIDKKGNYYYGATDPGYEDIWCELWIKYPDGRVKQIKKFNVTEVTRKTAPALGVGLVLDHSGSMGNLRCYTLQKGAMSFINKKRNFDLVSVVKFDQNTKTEVGISASVMSLLRKLKLNGDDGFGGSTAMYDGIYTGIEDVIKVPKQTGKAVIVMTDGYENSSFTYLNQLILFAIENNVKVFTVGFGNWINKPLLKTIAYQTGGSFYELYQTKDFNWIFNDVYNKITNHYSINFKTPKAGKYAVWIKTCSKLVKNSSIVAFDNKKINYNKIPEKGSTGFGLPVSDLSKKISVKDFKSNKPIKDLENLVNTEGSNLDFYEHKEFDNIVFPDIKFKTNTTIIVKGTDKGLDKVIEFLKKHKHIIIEISGHTDEVGGNTDNMILSKRRAGSVKQLIVKQGINKNRIITSGYGETRPIATNKTKAGKLKNRRVEFKIIK